MSSVMTSVLGSSADTSLCHDSHVIDHEKFMWLLESADEVYPLYYSIYLLY
jgi:hypothetical protein